MLNNVDDLIEVRSETSNGVALVKLDSNPMWTSTPLCHK